MATYRRHSRHRRRATNPGATTGVLKSMTSGFSLPNVKTGSIMALGAVVNYWLASKIGTAVPFLGGKLTNVGVGIATAGAMLMIPKIGDPLFKGAMTGTLVKAVKDTGLGSKLGMGELYMSPRAQLNELLFGGEGMAELVY